MVANPEAAPDANTSTKALLEEVKQQYNNEFARKGTLETNANNIITIAGTIATLLFGFGTFLVDKLGSKYGLILLLLISVSLAFGIIFIIMSIILSVRVSRIQKYEYAISPLYFYREGLPFSDRINIFKRYQDEEFCSVMIDSYLKCNEKNYHINNSKAKKLRKSQRYFVIGMLPIPAIVFILLITLLTTSGTALPVNHNITGNNITLTVYRNGHAIDLKATLSPRPSLLPFLTTRSAPPSMPHPPIRPPTIPIPHP